MPVMPRILLLVTLTSFAAACGAKGGTPDAGSAGGFDAGPQPTCAPTAACTAADKSCLGLVSNAGLTKFGLRMSEIDFSAPAAFSSGSVETTLGTAAEPSLASCNLSGSATFSWLLQFDTAAGTLETGGAAPVADPTMGYSFDTAMINGVALAPVIFTGVTPDASGHFTIATGQNLNLPVYLSTSAASAFFLPISQARLTMGTLSSNNDCIGSYNAAGLEPANSCEPDSSHPLFIEGGGFDGFIKLTDADAVTISLLQESLCVLLSGNQMMYGTTAAVSTCTTDSNGNIVFQGDWCSVTNAAATASCADAVHVAGMFAASSVKIN